MASLLPLLHDLLPMIIPSKVHIARDGELAAVVERAETPPWDSRTPRRDLPQSISAQQQTDDADIDDPRSLAPSQPAPQAEPIELLDREEISYDRSTTEPGCEGVQGARLGMRYPGEEPESDAAASGPRVFRKDAMVGVTDTMCATGKPSHSSSCIGSILIRLFSLRTCVPCLVSRLFILANACGHLAFPAPVSGFPLAPVLIFCVALPPNVLWTL